MFCKKCGTEMDDGQLFCKRCGTKAGERGTVANVSVERQKRVKPAKNRRPRKKINVKKVVAVVVLLLVCTGAGFFTYCHVTPSNQLAYVQDGYLYYCPNMNRPNQRILLEEYDESKTTDVEFSDNGKYLYYISSQYELKCVDLRWLLPFSEVCSEKFVEKIGEQVIHMEVVADRTVLYQASHQKMYVYNGKVSEEVGEINDYILSETSPNLLVEKKNGGESDWCLYNYETGKMNVVVKKGQSLIDYDKALENYYVKDGNELFKVDSQGEQTSIITEVDAVVDVSIEDGRIYYARAPWKDMTLYDYAEDPSSEAEKEKPFDIKNYMNEVRVSKALSKRDYKEYRDWGYDVFREYDSEEEGFVYDWDWDNDVDMYEYHNRDDGQDYFFDAEDETGKWYLFQKEDYKRAKIRSNLKEFRGFSNIYNVYVWNEGKEEEVILEKIDGSTLWIDGDSQMMSYKELSFDPDKKETYPIEEMPSQQELIEKLGLDSSGNPTRFVGENIDEVIDVDIKRFQVSENRKMVVMNQVTTGIFYVYELKKNKLTQCGELGKDIVVGSWNEDGFVYACVEDKLNKCASVWEYKDGQVRQIAYKMRICDLIQDEDGNFFFLDKSDCNNLYKDKAQGSKTYIDSNVECFKYVDDKHVIYTKNNKLYRYAGKKNSRYMNIDIAGKDKFWCHEIQNKNEFADIIDSDTK